MAAAPPTASSTRCESRCIAIVGQGTRRAEIVEPPTSSSPRPIIGSTSGGTLGGLGSEGMTRPGAPPAACSSRLFSNTDGGATLSSRGAGRLAFARGRRAGFTFGVAAFGFATGSSGGGGGGGGGSGGAGGGGAWVRGAAGGGGGGGGGGFGRLAGLGSGFGEGCGSGWGAVVAGGVEALPVPTCPTTDGPASA